MAIHIHPMNELATHKTPAVVAPTSPLARHVSQAVSDFEALFSASARQANVSVSAPATASTVTNPVSGSSATSASTSAASASAPASTNSSASASTSPGDGPAGPLFGPNPWLTDPTGSGLGTTTHYSPFYFATEQTAQTVASMVGGTVVSENEMVSSGTPFVQDQPNLMVQLPNGGLVNPGLIATFFTHNWPTSFVNQQIANEVAGAAPASAGA